MTELIELVFQQSIETELSGIRRVSGICKIKDLVDLINVATLDSNPRKPKVNAITKSMVLELKDANPLYTLKTRGILVGAANVEDKSSLHFRCTFDDQRIEGILDGGHNSLAIGLAILEEATGRQNEVGMISTWPEFKKFWKSNFQAIEDWRKETTTSSLANSLIAIEFIMPGDPNNDVKLQKFRQSIMEICAARNTSTPLTESTMIGKYGLLEPLKKRIQEPYLSQIQWEQNGVGRLKVDQLISLAMVPLKCYVEKFPVTNAKGRPIRILKASSLYAQRTNGVKAFGKIMSSNSVTKQSMSYRREIDGPEIASIFDLAADIPSIYDHIFMRFPKAFSESSGVQFEQIQPIVNFNEKYRNSLILPFSGAPTPLVFPEALIQPLARGLGVLIDFDAIERRFYWKTEPKQFLDKHLTRLVAPIPTGYLETYALNPDKFGKDPLSILYVPVESLFRSCLSEEP